MKIFLASHGQLASGIQSSINVLLGASDKLTVFDAYVDEQSIDEVLQNYLANTTADEQIILLSDLYGGSVNQKMYQYLNRKNTYLIAGVNLGLVLELVVKEDDLSSQEIMQIVEASRSMMRMVELDTNDIEEEAFF